jgi:hypothetical protein
VTARVKSSGQAFQFRVTDAALLKSVRVGQGVYANLKTGQVSVNGIQPCCNVISSPSVAQSSTAPWGPDPYVMTDPSCNGCPPFSETLRPSIPSSSSTKVKQQTRASLSVETITQWVDVWTGVNGAQEPNYFEVNMDVTRRGALVCTTGTNVYPPVLYSHNPASLPVLRFQVSYSGAVKPEPTAPYTIQASLRTEDGMCGPTSTTDVSCANDVYTVTINMLANGTPQCINLLGSAGQKR